MWDQFNYVDDKKEKNAGASKQSFLFAQRLKQSITHKIGNIVAAALKGLHINGDDSDRNGTESNENPLLQIPVKVTTTAAKI